MLKHILYKKPISFSQFKKFILGINDEDLIADVECRQLQIISDSLQKRFKIDEVEALTKGLDILDDLKQGGLL